MRAAAVLAVLLPLMASAQPTRGACHADSDCTLSNFAGCCGTCCPSPVSAISVDELMREQGQCATIDCTRPRCEAVKCAAVDANEEAAKRAVCRAGQCVTQSAPKAEPEPACRVDSDCTMSTFAGCCGNCCPQPPRAFSVKDLKRQQDVCAVATCAARMCATVKCAAPVPPAEEVAVCRAGACVAEAAQAECRADGDCELVPAPPSGCCSTRWLARPLEKMHIMDDAPRPPSVAPQKQADPHFGLSTGSSGSGCGACPAMPPARAACRVARCVVLPMKR